MTSTRGARFAALLAAWLLWGCIGAVVAAPGLAIHPAIPSADDEVFVGRYSIWCGAEPVIREPIPDGMRVRVPVDGPGIVFGGEVNAPCLQSIGRLGAGRHEIVPYAASDDDYTQRLAASVATVVLNIPAGARPAEVDTWTFEPTAMNAAPAFRETTDAIVRLSGNRFAAITQEAGTHGVTVFGRAPGDWQRIGSGFPGPMYVSGLHVDVRDTLYAVAALRQSGSFDPAIWRFDTGTQRWTRHADYPGDSGNIIGILQDGVVLTARFTGSDYALMRFEPGKGWRSVGFGAPTSQVLAFGRTADESVIAVAADYPASGPAFRVLRFSAATGLILSSRPVALANLRPAWIQTDPAGAVLLIGRSLENPDPSKYTIDRIDAAGSVARVATDLDRFPLAVDAGGTHLTVDGFFAVRLQEPGKASTPIAVGGLGPGAICGDMYATQNSFTPSFTLCSQTGATYYSFDRPRIDPPRASAAGIEYYTQVSANSLVLMRGPLGNSLATPFVDLTPALKPGSADLYRAAAMRLVASPDQKRLFLLVHQYLLGDGYSSRVIEIELETRAVSAVDMPSLLSTDLAMSSSGALYVTTRFGEILRRQSAASGWTTFGHLTTDHLDLHVTFNGAGRAYVYGYHGLMAQQGLGTRVEEFHHAGLDHYFMTADRAEADSLRHGAAPGWLATGEGFPAIAANPWGPGAAAPREVCRFYGSVAPGPNSHFYTAVPSECNGLKALQQSTPASLPRWNYEGTAFHSVTGLAGGNCFPTEQMVVRFFNGGSARGLEPNHRYVQGSARKAEMTAAGWIAEESAFCVPNETQTRTFAR